MRTRLLRGAATAAATVAFVLSGLAHPGHAAPQPGTLLSAPPGQAIENSYTVVLKPDRAVARSAVDSVARDLAASVRGRIGHVYRHALQGFEVTLDRAAAQRLAADPAVAYVEQNSVMRLQDTQFNATYGISRIDDRSNTRDYTYTYPTTASNVTVYVIDSGIQATHFDFEFRVLDGASFGTTAPASSDCLGHGTHVAGTIGSATYGVAKAVTLIPVRVFDCADTTSTANVIAGLDWIYQRQLQNPGELAVVNMSIDGPINFVLESFVNGSINRGHVYTAAAGNDRINACTVSPANIPNVVTVGGMFSNDERDSQTNVGPCVDLYAPSDAITSLSHLTDFGTAVMSGTSMSSAHAAGVAAIIRSLHPTLTAVQVHDLMRQTAVHGMGWYPYDTRFSALYLQQVVIGPPLPAYSNVMQGHAVGRNLIAAGGAAPYTWSANGLPAGITIDAATGRLSGIIRGTGAYTITVTARDALGRTGYITEKWQIIRDPCPTC